MSTTYFDYLAQKQASSTMKSILLVAEQLTPEIDMAIDNVIDTTMAEAKDTPLLDLAIATSLGISFVSRLKELADVETEFNLTSENVETFALQLIKSIF